jgi:hypothetical protein
MSKVITFSRTYPSYHARKGEGTLFVEKILNDLNVDYHSEKYFQKLLGLNTVNLFNGKLSFQDIRSFHNSLTVTCMGEKKHTIRNGNRFNIGELFSPRVWFGKAYNSPMIIFWDDILINKTWDISVVSNGIKGFAVLGSLEFPLGLHDFNPSAKLAKNDGLNITDLIGWFNKPLTGQIICWNKYVNY